MDLEQINTFIEAQLEQWPLARTNYHNLGKTDRRLMQWGRLRGAVQHNPARIASTGADVSADAIKERKCFLCSANRPQEQFSIPFLEGWDFLLNPFPILPVHFTIADKSHTPQAKVPLEMAAMAELAPDLAIFYNGAKAGASAPDHRHLQGVLKSELPLLAEVEACHPATDYGLKDSATLAPDFPFRFISAVISPDAEGMRTLAAIPHIYGADPATDIPDAGLVNTFFWIGKERLLRAIVIPRKRHRPACYYHDGGEKILVSPGAIDMAGLIITPRQEDFNRISESDILQIFSETAYTDTLPIHILDILDRV